MNQYQRKRILITAKTYPTPSTKYTETVCTAGITDGGEWIRLYPVRFRQLVDNSQYKLFSWIDVDVKKNDRDVRPESYHVDDSSIKILKELDANKDLVERCNVLLPLVKPSVESLSEDYEKSKSSLGIIKPAVIHRFIKKRTSSEWSDADLSKLNQMNLFDSANSGDIRQLKKVPYEFSLRFSCDDSCRCTKPHEISIHSWEYNWSYFKYLERYSTENEALYKLEESWLSQFEKGKEGFLILGTVYPHNTFIIIGHFSYLKRNYKPPTHEQLSLL